MDKRLIEMEADGEPSPPISARTTATLRDFLFFLRRRKLPIVSTVLLGLVVSVVYVVTATPRYTASLQLAFAATPVLINDLEAILRNNPIDEAYLLTEVETLHSRALASRVIEQLGLLSDGEFNPSLQPRNMFDQFIHETRNVLGHSEKETSPEEKDKEVSYVTMDGVLQRLSVRHVMRSRVLELAFTSVDPAKAAAVVNEFADQYLLLQLEEKFERAQKASAWLASKIQKLRDHVEESEANIEYYRQHHDLLAGEHSTLIVQKISELSSRLTEATIARNAAEANLAQAKRLVSNGDVFSMMQILDSALIQKYREQELELERKESEMSEQFGSRHPLIIQLNAEKQAFKRKLQDEINKIARGVENEAQIARQREAALSKEIEAKKQQLATSNAAAVGLRTLQRDADANRLVLEQFMNAFTQTTEQQDASAQTAPARIVSRAEPPIRPSFPRKVPIVFVAVTGSLGLGILLAFAMERLDVRYRSAEEIEADVGIPVLAHVPAVKPHELQTASLAEYVLQCPGSAFVESIRSVYRALMLTSGDIAPKRTILFTSAQVGEGKTTIALTLARLQAKAGQNVVFIDGDFRRSPVSRWLNLRETPGLIDLLTGCAELHDVIQCEATTGAKIIVAGRFTPEAADVIDSDRFSRLIATMRETYQLVVLDSPPLSALSDATVFAYEADNVMLVVKWGATNKSVVRYTANMLSKLKIRPSGVVLSKIDVVRQASYGFGDSETYRGEALEYYRYRKSGSYVL